MTEKKTEIVGDAGGGRQVSIPVDLPSNANKVKKSPLDRPDKTKEERPKPDRITTSDVIRKRKGFGTKLRETFTGDDARSVGNYLLFDVVIPAFKSMLADAASQGTERLLFGSSSSRSRPRDRERTPYNRMYTSRGDREDRGPREMSSRARATHNFDEIIVETRVEAEEVLDQLTQYVDDYGSARVSDLYEMVGITGNFTDDRWGWTSLRDSGVRRVRNGYLLLLPRPEPIE